MSKFHYLSDDEITECISGQSRTLRACLLDTETSFLVITAPPIANHQSADNLRQLLDCLKLIGLIPNVYKAAASEDLQIYLSFNKAAKTTELAQGLECYLSSIKLDAAENCFVHHSTQSLFTLPLQAGFCWLNEDFSVKVNRDDIALPAAMAMFLRDLERAAVNPSLLLEWETKESVFMPLQNEYPTASFDATLEADSAHYVVTELETEPASICCQSQPEARVRLQPQRRQYRLPTIESERSRRTGMVNQLKLFSVAPARTISELPKKQVKRGRRPRSSLPDEAGQDYFLSNKTFQLQSTANLTVLSSQWRQTQTTR